jgi:hypothetical protein
LPQIILNQSIENMMKIKQAVFLLLLAFCVWHPALSTASAQGTAFTYQGRLASSNSPACGNYDFTFALFNNSSTNSGQIGNTLTNLNVGVTNGLFTVMLDFSNVFSGNALWLAIGVRTNGGGAFTALNPLQQLTPTPYAVFASTASNLSGTLPSAQLSGPLPSTQINGTYSNAVTFSNSANNFTGTFSGDGSGLTNIPQAYLNVLRAGVTNDGVTDVTVPLQNLLNNGGAFYFPPGRYYAQELTITNNTTLLGSGAVLVYANNSWNQKVFVSCLLNTNITIYNIGFEGGWRGDPSMNTFITYNGTKTFAPTSAQLEQLGYWNEAGRHGLQINTDAGGTISGLTIQGFLGIGLLPVSSSGTSAYGRRKTVITGITLDQNLFGLYSTATIGQANVTGYITNLINNIYVIGAMNPEYESYSQINCFSNTVGLRWDAGNCSIVDSSFSGNYIGEVNISGGNQNHNLVEDCFFNHNTQNAIYYYSGGSGPTTPAGTEWIGCRFDANANIMIDTAFGIKFQGCTFVALCLTNVNTPSGNQSFFVDNYYDTWAQGNISNDGGMVFKNNYSWVTANDIANQTIAASGVTNNVAPRDGVAVITATATTYWVSNSIGQAVATNTTITGTCSIPLPVGWCIHAASGLTGYLFFP